MLREELNEYRFKINDDLPSLDPAGLVGSSLLVGILTAIPAWLLEQDLEHLWEYGHWLLVAGGLLYATWRWHNDPPEAVARMRAILCSAVSSVSATPLSGWAARSSSCC